MSVLARPFVQRRMPRFNRLLISLEDQIVREQFFPIIPIAIFAYQLEWLTSIAPGFLKLPYVKFVVYDILAVCLYVSVFTTLGYLGEALAERVRIPFVDYARYVIIVLAIVVTP